MIEGMWTFRSGTADSPDDLRFGGIVTLETQRVFGGDSAMAYTGEYEISNGRLKARVKSWVWNDGLDPEEWDNVFLASFGDEYFVIFEGAIYDAAITGHIYREDQPNIKLAAAMHKICDLP